MDKMTKIQLRHDTAANFANENPILLAGEAAIETDTNKMKIGNGTTAYNSLEYFAEGGGSVDAYTKAETDELLDTKIPIDSVTAPLNYSVASHSVQSITLAGDNNEYCYLTNANSNSLSGSGSGTRTYSVKTTAKDVLDGDYNIVAQYNNLISDNSPWIVFNYNLNYSRNSQQTRYTPTIGHTDSEGKFTPYVLCDMGLYGKSLFVSNSSTSSEVDGYTTYTLSGGHIYQENWNDPENYSGVMIKLEISGTNVMLRCKIIQADGTITDSVWDNKTLGTLVDFQSYNLNTVIFNTTSNFANSISNLLKVAETGIFNTTELTSENQLWSVADITYTKYLQLNIGTGLAVQNGNLVNTNPTPPIAGAGIDITNNEISILAGAGLSFNNTAQLPNTYSSSSADITASSQETGQYAFQAFDGNTRTYWGLTQQPSSSDHAWVQRHHDAIRVTSVKILFTSEVIKDIYIKGSNDGTNFTQIGQFINNTNTDITITCNPSQAYTYTRIEYGQPYSGWGQTKEIQISYETDSSVLVNTIDVSNKVTGTGISNMVKCTQAEYDALVQAGTVDASTFYVIVATNS